MKIFEPRIINGVNFIGPDLFEHDDKGFPVSPIASAFPKYRALITGRGIHALHIGVMLDFLEARGCLFSQNTREEEERRLCEDAVSLIIRDHVVLIRLDPEDMNHIFAADQMLQQIFPKKYIQFTGAHITEVRWKLRQRGECWRMSPAPHSTEAIKQYIQSSKIKVETGAIFYQNASSGERFLTYEEFMRIRPLLRQNKAEALSRLREIVNLTQLVNAHCVPELSFFLPLEEKLTIDLLQKVIFSLESLSASNVQDTDKAENLFDQFATLFATAVSPELAIDAINHPAWRTTMFCRLYGISENDLEEVMLRLSPEFRLNIKWLPGAVIDNGNLVFEPEVEYRVRKLITHYHESVPDIISINVGQVESSQTERDRTGEEREVYLAVMGFADGHKDDIRIIRRMKWDVLHHLKQGKPVALAISETQQYRDYIFDRLKAMRELGIAVLNYNEITFPEKISGSENVPIYFFDRCYVPGIITDKILPSSYSQKGFIKRLARLLGEAAAMSLTMGRVHPGSGHLFFDDGDELVQFDKDGLPEHLVIVDTTGSFNDWKSPESTLLPHCLEHLSKHLEKARQNGATQEELNEAIAEFSVGLTAEIVRLQNISRESFSHLCSLFADRGEESGGIHSRWEGILCRLQTTDTQELTRMIINFFTLQCNSYRPMDPWMQASASHPLFLPGAHEDARL